MSDDIYQDLKPIIRAVTSTDAHQVTSAPWWGLTLGDIALVLDGREVRHVDWCAEGEPRGEFEARVLIFTDDFVFDARYDQEGDRTGVKHSVTVWSRKTLVWVDASAQNPPGDVDGPGRITVQLKWNDGTSTDLPLRSQIQDLTSLQALIPSLLKDMRS